MPTSDPRRRIPRTDHLLALPEVRAAADRLGTQRVRTAVRASQEAARRGELAPEEVAADALARITELEEPARLRPVLNATGVVVHTNLGRAPLSAAARTAIATASGYVDLELDLATGARARRGDGARAALLAACPAASDALVVNNGAAALLLAVAATSAGRDVVISRGELIEIGGGFRLPELLAATGARLREVGTTNRTHPRDYAVDADTGCVLKVHPSNFTLAGFTADVDIAELSTLATEHRVPLLADLGSGLLQPDPALVDEPDATSALAAGADLVILSGDKLLGGPQAGILLGRGELIATLARHPLARAVRADKLTLAALEATLLGGAPPVTRAVHADADRLRERAEALAGRLPADLAARVVPHDGRVGGGGAPGVPLPGWAVRVPETLARPLRLGDPAVVARTHDGACLLDLRCIPDEDDGALAEAVLAAHAAAR